ncbi:MAG: hypothetical protein R2715_12655 [Ilumatobacteraceae bacterium]
MTETSSSESGSGTPLPPPPAAPSPGAPPASPAAPSASPAAASPAAPSASPAARPEAPEPKKRRWVLPVAVIAALGLGIGGTAVLLGGNSDDGDASASATTESGDPGGSTGAGSATQFELPSSRWLLDPIPENFALSWISDPSSENNDFGQSPSGTMVLLAAPGTTVDEGPWLTVSVRTFAEMTGGRFDPQMMLNVERPENVRVGEFDGAAGTSWDGSEQLTYGPVDTDYAVTLAADGLTRAQLVTIGAALKVAGGAPRLDPSVLPVEMEVVTTSDASWDTSPSALAYGPISVNYNAATPTSEGGFLMLNQRLRDATGDPLRVARFLLSDAEDVTVHGQPAVLGRPSADQFGGGFDAKAVVWAEGDSVLYLYTQSDLDLMALAESTIEADSAAWDAAQEEMLAEQRRQEEFWNNPPPAWLIGAGELDSSTTWIVEGSLLDNEDGPPGLVVSLNEMQANGSTGMGYDPSQQVTEFPNLYVAAGGMESRAIVGFGPLDPTGYVLRVTTEDGTVIEEPLRTVRPDWPASAAAVGLRADVAFTAEIVGPDGVTVSSTEAEAGQVFDNNGGIAVETTAVAAGG